MGFSFASVRQKENNVTCCYALLQSTMRRVSVIIGQTTPLVVAMLMVVPGLACYLASLVINFNLVRAIFTICIVDVFGRVYHCAHLPCRTHTHTHTHTHTQQILSARSELNNNLMRTQVPACPPTRVHCVTRHAPCTERVSDRHVAA